MTTFYYLPQFKTTTLSVGGGIDDSQTTGIVLQSVSGVDITKPGIICVTWADPLDTSTAEWITYTSINGSNELQGVVRGAEGSTARSHLNGAIVAYPLSKTHINNINDHLTAMGTTNIPYGWDGWIPAAETWTYVSANSFKVSGVDVTAKYPKGTRVKFTQTTVKYGVVYSSAFSTDTTITLIANDDYSVANAAISDNYYSYEVNPQNFPFWFNYTSTDGAGGSMTWGTVTTSYCKFRVIGKEMNVAMKKLGTTGGSASTSLTATLPCNAARESYQNTLIFNTGTVTNGLTRVDSGSTTITMQIIPVGNFSLGANTGILGSNIIVEI